jgi:hypothetical protein
LSVLLASFTMTPLYLQTPVGVNCTEVL